MFYEYLVKLQVLKSKNALSKRLIFFKVQSFANNFGLNIHYTLEFEPCCNFPPLSTKTMIKPNPNFIKMTTIQS